MKRISIVTIAFIMIVLLARCGPADETTVQTTSGQHTENSSSQHTESTGLSGESINEDVFEFISDEEFLTSYRLVKAGKADGDIKQLADSVNLVALEKLYTPSSIPNNYKLYKIDIYENVVSSLYFLEEHMVSESAIRAAISQSQFFSFNFYRWDSNSPMEGILRQQGATEKDLINGKYLFVPPYSLCWEIDRGVMQLDMPASIEVIRGETSIVDYLGLNSVEELAQFAELKEIDLTALAGE